jgi:hypothetical protein
VNHLIKNAITEMSAIGMALDHSVCYEWLEGCGGGCLSEIIPWRERGFSMEAAENSTLI